ncbi:MarR family transcriptional regulator [Nonomuraea terrae]|uniref:MarR family transcriptional regulator n=1 Tax=Nonomuraea terrae TaxID=2530383 RepID=A0A4R4ZD82_9ACTN|nr:MarR family transcriptional regulator [Nonomuraea terrae]TDD56255.1 MarR family transcriptional regulator [Nonomuraea terrae]
MHKPLMDVAIPQGSADALTIAVEQLVRHVRLSATTGGLSSAASFVLSRLAREGPQRLTELARAEGVSQPNMSQLVNRLERGDLVRRTADHSDGRGVLVEVTDTGVEVFLRRRAERALALQQLIDELTEQEQHAVAVALPALARVIEDRRPPRS